MSTKIHGKHSAQRIRNCIVIFLYRQLVFLYFGGKSRMLFFMIFMFFFFIWVLLFQPNAINMNNSTTQYSTRWIYIIVCMMLLYHVINTYHVVNGPLCLCFWNIVNWFYVVYCFTLVFDGINSICPLRSICI